MRILLISLFQIYTAFLIGQGNNLFTNSKLIDDSRYEGVKASPYQFENWPSGTIYTLEGDPIEVQEINFNGYSKEIEIRKENKFIELDQSLYSRIELGDSRKPSHIFVRDFADSFRTRFIELVHDGAKVKCVRQFIAPMSDIVIQNVGKTEKIKRFNPKFVYTFIREGNLEEVKIKEKQLLEYLGHKKELNRVLDNKKFKNDKLKHLIDILTFYESL